jgi:dethiobiotin synthetase
MSKRYFVTGIGTGVGKTLVSTVLAEALKADYFKPVQCGDLDNTDEDFVRDNLFNSRSKVHPTQHLFRLAASPHAAAKAEGKTLSVDMIVIPQSNNCLIVEGAGGILVPLNLSNEFVIDIAKHNSIEIILIVDYYLGSINHSLLTLKYLKSNNYKIGLLVFNGDRIESSKQAILVEAKDIPYIEINRIEVSPEGVKSKADEIAQLLEEKLFVR